jgi:hemolysin activation/secretion protein
VITSRIGGAANFGDYEFFQANTLGGEYNLRGYRKMRFSGRYSVYHNNDLRLKLFYIDNYFVPFHLGILGLADYGRVWIDNEDSSKWHIGYGGGVWLNFIERFLITGTYATSEEDNVIDVSVGYLF